MPDAIFLRLRYFGLGNRLRTLGGFRLVAERWRCPLYVVWVSEAHCPGLLTEAFAPASFFFELLAADRYLDTLMRCQQPKRFDWDATALSVVQAAGLCGLPAAAAGQQAMAWLRRLQPAALVHQQLEAVSRDWPARSQRLGVHVRRTDLRAALARTHAVCDQALWARLDRAASEPDTRFVVAADNPESLQQLQTRYGRRVLTAGGDWTAGGIRRSTLAATALDLFALRTCRAILGTTGSTFSSLAAELADIPLEML